MGSQYLRVSFVVLVIILALSQQSTCRHIHKNMGEKTKQTDKFNFSSKFSRYFSTESGEGSNKVGTDPTYGVSLRQVPGGPNPLHN
ncbi:hypothetical protein I3843_11G134600 [Carya illinoinensis]|uniref:Uncharacterized protein n=1 Tax=Carya illinoinensis TaxID=32201 RepID=A0A8T1P2B3_CARIL|nr:hypothetical protein I3760_11G134700 [Carya illinoinensis]KAG6636835.1 hypothetical protein CIPAW_11G138500 [Carya illinoinensis]KAG6688688.1 hypothetical protein I3842_11G136900 [Carya illinoinensis]KAG7956664.1 hypothetical protein I3843_11G134600 [Carya illinoinensis]